MTALTVFLAPDEGAGETLDVLHDLSGAGLLEPFLWLPATDAISHEFAAVAVADGRRTLTSLQDVVVDERHDRVRLCVLVPLTACAEPLPGLVEQDVADLLATNAGNAPVTRIRYLLTRGGSQVPELDGVAHEGWHNVFVAPEQSTGPGAGHWVLPGETPPGEAARQLAPMIAGITGLWTGAPGCVLDTLPVPAGRSVRAMRAFYRRVEAGGLEAELRARVLTSHPKLPQPRQRHGAPTVYLKDAGVACSIMATNLWNKHAHLLLAGQRAQVEVRSEPKIGLGTAASSLPSYLLAAVRNDPKRWYDRVVARSTVLHQDQAATFTALPGAHTWIVWRAGPDGRPLGWDEIGDIADKIDAALPPLSQAPSRDGYVDLSGFGRDFAEGALTLADAGDRGGQTMPPAQVGSSRGVLRVTEAVVPGPEQDFVLAPGNVAVRAGITAVAACDVLGTDVLRRRLAWIAQDKTLTPEADATRRALDRWQEHHQATYAYYVGSRLGDQVRAAGEELRGQLAALAEAASEPDELFRAQQRRQHLLSRIVAGIATTTLAAAVLTALLMALVFRVTGAAVLALVEAMLAGALAISLAYGIGQRRLFRELRRRQVLIERVEAEQPNLRRVLREYRQLRDAYSDLLLWSRSVAAVLREPFGRAPAGVAGTEPPVLRDLPQSVRIGRAVVDPEVLRDAVVTLRRDLFVSGWLTGPWHSNLHLAARRYAAGGTAARSKIELESRRDESPELPLQSWSQDLTANGPTPDIGHQVWASVLESLTESRADIGAALLSTISPQDRRGGTQPLSGFMAGVDRASDAVDHWFDAAHFTALGQTNDRARVSASTSFGSQRGLTRIDVLVQFGEAFPAWDLELGSEGPVTGDGPRASDEPTF